ncbi:universal stress protein [Vibrio sp. ABG19]|uniref:universal stress protein n=1 Tax=Vibrio sp. ABG19 TaxID=2817385 RepID=UPI00249ECDB5|nr:universal stress protein [Vibrio sp. ABG19]WGY47123.1 universal stress protein [Vibrio sp. ABG19]
MKRFENILYATQGLPGHSDALDQAIRIALNNGVSVTGLIACPAFPQEWAHYQQSYEHSLSNSLQEKVARFRSEHDLSEQQAPFPLLVKHSEQPAICIIKQALENDHDLIIKEAEPLRNGAGGFKALDMTLLRKCPCAVWLHRPTDKPKNKRRVVVAIDPTPSGEAQHALSLRLLELARSIADSCDSRLHLISCWEYYLEHYLEDNSWIHADPQELNQEIDKAKNSHQRALQQLLEESGIAGETVTHYLHGNPDDAIPECVQQEDVDVLVMGTLARTGIAGFVIGNTAENILQSIRCSLVALKPEGFVSPIKS